jgi:Kef-type K+ transport system membrane component KefB
MIENILLVLLLLLLSAKIMGSLFSRIGLDSSIGELLTGIVFGVSILKLIPPDAVEPFAIIGSVLILFIAGLKQQDIMEIYKDHAAIKMGVLLLAITGFLMSVLFYVIPKYFSVHFTLLQAVVLGLAFAIIDIGLPAKIMISKGLINQPAGKIAIRAAIVDIVLGLVLFTCVTIFLAKNSQDVLIKVGGIILFLAITLGLVYFLSRISKFVFRLHVEEAEFSLAVLLILALAYFTEVIGFSSVLGAFLAGVLVARMPFAETRSFSDKIKSISFGLFVPLFFVWFGLTINLSEIWKNIILAGIIFVAYILIRFVIAYWYIKRNKLQSPGLIATSMLSVDVESLVILMVAGQIGIFGTEIALTLFAPSVFLSTLLIVILVAILSKKKGMQGGLEGVATTVSPNPVPEGVAAKSEPTRVEHAKAEPVKTEPKAEPINNERASGTAWEGPSPSSSSSPSPSSSSSAPSPRRPSTKASTRKSTRRTASTRRSARTSRSR